MIFLSELKFNILWLFPSYLEVNFMSDVLPVTSGLGTLACVPLRLYFKAVAK